MSTRSIERNDVFPGAVGDFGANVAPIYLDSDNEILKVYDRTNSVWNPVGQPYARSLTASAALLLEDASRPVIVNAAAGLTITLPVATGSGKTFRIFVGTLLTSNSIIIDVAGSDKFYGGIFINDTGDTTAATADYFPAVGGSSVHLTLAQSVGAGKIGDWVEVTDLASVAWGVKGVLNGELDPTTPWS
jgi:hypothetical protein